MKQNSCSKVSGMRLYMVFFSSSQTPPHVSSKVPRSEAHRPGCTPAQRASLHTHSPVMSPHVPQLNLPLPYKTTEQNHCYMWSTLSNSGRHQSICHLGQPIRTITQASHTHLLPNRRSPVKAFVLWRRPVTALSLSGSKTDGRSELEEEAEVRGSSTSCCPSWLECSPSASQLDAGSHSCSMAMSTSQPQAQVTRGRSTKKRAAFCVIKVTWTMAKARLVSAAVNKQTKRQL